MKLFVKYSCCDINRELPVLEITNHVYSFKRQLLWKSWQRYPTPVFFSKLGPHFVARITNKNSTKLSDTVQVSLYSIFPEEKNTHTMRRNNLLELTDDFVWGKTWNRLRQSTFENLNVSLWNRAILKKRNLYLPLQLLFQCNRMALKLKYELLKLFVLT